MIVDFKKLPKPEKHEEVYCCRVVTRVIGLIQAIIENEMGGRNADAPLTDVEAMLVALAESVLEICSEEALKEVGSPDA